jgi:hypothetical protein
MNGFMCERCRKEEATGNIRGWYVCDECYIVMTGWDNKKWKGNGDKNEYN